jgi:hypothetical protein
MDQDCLDSQTPPPMSPGDTTESGEYFRNLKKDHVAKRYQDDDNESPSYGFKLTRKCWKDADGQRGDLSVNLVTCIHSAECSLAIQAEGTHYYHVATINLDAVNRMLSTPFVAIYAPLDDPKNTCHFEIAPLEGTVSKWQELAALFDDPFPEGKLPRNENDRARAAEAFAQYQQMIRIRRWVRNHDGLISC